MSEAATLPVRPTRRAVKLKRDQAVRRLSRAIIRASPWLTPIDGALVRGWSQLERLAMEAYQTIKEEGMMRADGTPHPLVAELTKLRRAQSQLGAQIGIGPRARAEVQSGSRLAPIDGVFERIERAHAERHSEDEATAD